MTANSLDMHVANRETTTESTSSHWQTLYRAGAIAALSLVGFTVIQATVFIAWPPPSFQPTASAVNDWFTLLQNNWLIGLLDLDLLMLIDYPASLLLYLALYAALERTNRSLSTIAVAVGLTGIAAYFPANPAFTMLSLSNQYIAATTDAQQSMLLAAGQATLAVFQGSAFNASYIMIAVAGLIMSLVMLQGNTFSRSTAYLGVLFYAMNLVPATAGTLGFVLSLASLVPMVVWLILVARRLFQLAQEKER